MKYICARCEKELELKNYGGHAVTELKNLCPECWKDYIEIKKKHHHELNKWWRNNALPKKNQIEWEGQISSR